MQFTVILTCERGIFVTIPNENTLAALSCGTEIWISERLSGTSTDDTIYKSVPVNDI